MRRCHSCHVKIPDVARFCPHCGTDLIDGPAPVPVIPTRPPNQRRWPWIVGVVAVSVLTVIRSSHVSAPPRGETARDRMRLSDPVAEAGEAQRAIDGAGEPCGNVTRFYQQGTDRGRGYVYWNAACSNGRSYSIRVQTDGTYNVTSCAILELAHLECFKPLADQ
jgi:hypothetical protein